MEHIELLVAAEVRQLAFKLRESDWLDAFTAADFNSTTKKGRAEGGRAKVLWLEQHPVSNYVQDAYKRVCDVAIQIQSLASS